MLAADAWQSWVELPKREQKRWKKNYPSSLIPSMDSAPLKRLTQLMSYQTLTPYPMISSPCYGKRRNATTQVGGSDESLAKIWESADCGSNMGWFASGRLLVAFDPYLPNIEGLVVQRVRATVRKWRCLFPKPFAKSPMHRPPGRLRIRDWLAVIRNFEQIEMDRDPRTKRDDQLFARYRRIIGSWIL